jgi:ApaG protein
MSRPEFTCTVAVRPLPEQTDPEQDRYGYAYTITIRNTGDVGAQLIARHWRIVDSQGRRASSSSTRAGPRSRRHRAP